MRYVIRLRRWQHEFRRYANPMPHPLAQRMSDRPTIERGTAAEYAGPRPSQFRGTLSQKPRPPGFIKTNSL